MLTDDQIKKLKSSDEYKKITNIGLQGIATDLFNSGSADLLDGVSSGLLAIFQFGKKRTIKSELFKSSTELIERILNMDLNMKRTPESIEEILSSKNNAFAWMRFDALRVETVFSRCIHLLSDASFRSIVKEYSTITQNKNDRLEEISNEVKALAGTTINYIRQKQIIDNFIEYTREEFYRENFSQMGQAMIKAMIGGHFGTPELTEGEVNNE